MSNRFSRAMATRNAIRRQHRLEKEPPISTSKAKGTRLETLIVDYLNIAGFPHAHRNPPAGNHDKGDIGGVPGIVLEVKNCQKMELAAWVDEAHSEAVNAECDAYAVVHKRRGRGNARDQYVTMPLGVFVELIR